jgi:hypothetical protein
MAIQVVANYVSVDEYAKRCGKKRRAIMDRIKAKSLTAMKVDGYLVINIASHPPKTRINPHTKSSGGGVHTAYKELRCVITWCWGKKKRCYPYLRAIINGKLDGWLIGDEVFAKGADLEAFHQNLS